MRDLDLNAPGLLNGSLVVSASAGSGKTFTLTVLVSAELGREAVRPFEILATTFSEAAAADLRERLLRPLDLLASLDEAAWAGLLSKLVDSDASGFEGCLNGLHLSERLRKSIKEVAQAAPLWRGASWAASAERARAFWRRTRREAEMLQVSTIHSLALGLLGQGEGVPEAILDASHPALLRVLRQAVREALQLPEEHPDFAPAHQLLAWAEKNWASLSSGHDGHRDAMGHLESEHLEPSRQALHGALERAEQALAPFAAEPGRAKDETSRYRHYFKSSCVLRIPGPDADLAQRIRWAARQSESADAAKTYFTCEFKEALATLGPVADAWEAWLCCLLVGALRGFEALKAEQGMATFGDLVRRAIEGIAQGGLEPPRPKLLLVDEYQDTSRAQDAFLHGLGAVRTVRVGDLKQAIYGFRGGDPDLLREHLEKAGERAFRLPANYRSTPPIVDLANRYVDEVWPLLDSGACGLDGRQCSIGASDLRVGLVRTAAPSQGTDLPGLGAWIAALSGEGGWSRAIGEPASVTPRRRALLLRQRTKLPALLLLLKKQGIQPYVVAKEGFWDSPGIRIAMAALEAVAHPGRSLPCAVLLRHLVGMSDDQLTALAGRRGLMGLGDLDIQAFPEERRDAVAWLLSLRGTSTRELAGRLLMQGRLLGCLQALRCHGRLEPLRARRNLGAFLAMLLELPESPAVAFARLDEERRGAERGDLPATPEDADLIIQTAHASKGLEYEDVILPLLNASPRPLRKGELKTDPETQALLLAWKLGSHAGKTYQRLKPLSEERQRRDDLNLLYVALTRARERMCLLLQAPKEPKAHSGARTWAEYGHHLAAAHTEALALVDQCPEAVMPVRAESAGLQGPARREVVLEDAVPVHAHGGAADRTRAKRQGEEIHDYLRDLLIRWEEPSAFAARLGTPPEVPSAKENASRFLEQFEARGWRHLRRRTELPLAGAAASGALGRADLVVWDRDRIHLLDFKHSTGFGEAELAGYGAQLTRYAQVLRENSGLPVEAWLVALRSGEWVRVELE